MFCFETAVKLCYWWVQEGVQKVNAVDGACGLQRTPARILMVPSLRCSTRAVLLYMLPPVLGKPLPGGPWLCHARR